MKVRWAKSAIADLTEIRGYIRERNPTAAKKVAENIRSRVALLQTQPNMGRAVPERPGARELVVDNYVIAYEVSESAIEIVHVWHGRQRWWG